MKFVFILTALSFMTYNTAAWTHTQTNKKQTVLFKQVTASAIATATLFTNTLIAAAEADITPCSSSTDPDLCISSASVKDISKFGGPWSYSISPNEAFARLKGVLEAEPGDGTVSVDNGAGYLKLKYKDTFVQKDMAVEFVVKGVADESEARVVTYKATNISKKTLDNLKKAAGSSVFTSTDAAGDSASSEGVLGQLKAFYGLQSGEGFEDVFDE